MKIPAANSAPWNIAESDNGGMPRLIRYRTDLAPFIASSDYPQRLVIIWEYDADNLNGMPSTEQSETMKCFENALDATLDSDRLAVLSLVFTCNGSREWHYYINRVDEVGLRINTALSEFPKLPIHLQVENDPEWEQISLAYQICGV